MSTENRRPKRANADLSPIVTIADVIVRVAEAVEVPLARRRAILSGLRSMCEAVNTEPENLVADVRHLRELLANVSPAAIGVTPRTWSNIRSYTLAALNIAGIHALPGRYRARVHPAWEALRALLPTDWAKHRISRFMGFCGANGILPSAVRAETFAQFWEAIHNSLLRDPGSVYHNTCKSWNEASAGIAGWPQLIVEVPYRRRDLAEPVEAFESSFRDDLERYINGRAEPDVFSEDYCKPLRAITLKQRRQHLLLLATALAKSGYAIKQITDLSVLVNLKNAEASLRFLRDRAGGKSGPFIARLATLLKTVAKHYVKANAAQVTRLGDFARNLHPQSRGFTEKNRAFLLQFSNPNRVITLLELPRKVISKIQRSGDRGHRAAVKVEMALAVAIELAIPLRVDNLAGLDLIKHLHREGDTLRLSIPASESKNGSAIDAELLPRDIRLYDIYVRDYLPCLAGKGTQWLFPGENGGRRQTGGFGSQLKNFIKAETGIEMTPHQFRHLAAKLYLDAHPGDYETVRRLLGHKNVVTTIRFYQELDRFMASKRYNELVTDLVAERGLVDSL